MDAAIETNGQPEGGEREPYDISKIDFEKLKAEFARSPQKNTLTQCLKDAIEKKLSRLLAQNPLRTDFQQHYESIIVQYNTEKDRVTIEQTFEKLLSFVKSLSQEEVRAKREGLTEETLAVFDLLTKDGLTSKEIKRIKGIAVELLQKLKAEKINVDHWRDKEATRDAVRVAIKNFLWNDQIGLPIDAYDEQEVIQRADAVFAHIFRAYPKVPSPLFEVAV